VAVLASDSVRVRDRDSGAFDELFAREYRRVVGIAYRVLQNGAEAEDVAQDVFCDFLRRHPADAPYAGPWLYRATTHAALNAVRGRKRRQRREEMGQPALATDPGPEQAVITGENRIEVRSALARLSEKQAAILVLRYSGLSYAEVAEALGVKIGQVGTLLRRAETALRKELGYDTSE